MDLWIRSQDKRMLCKPQYIELYGDNEVHFGDVNIGYRCVATYKSKERALEVLDEIQKFLQPDFKCDGYETETGNGYYNMIKLHFSEPNIFHKRIYEMPKE